MKSLCNGMLVCLPRQAGIRARTFERSLPDAAWALRIRVILRLALEKGGASSRHGTQEPSTEKGTILRLASEKEAQGLPLGLDSGTIL